MTTIRVVAAHEVVRGIYPRPVTEKDELAIAVGRAIDSALSKFGHEYSHNLRPTAASILAFATEVLDEGIRDADIEVPVPDRDRILGEIANTIRAYRKSEIFALPRPRSRLVLINGQAGVYAQPDYWDRQSRFYEMKSFRTSPPPPDVDLQLRLFQLAFPGLTGILISFDRHSVPVTVRRYECPPLTDGSRRETLLLALRIALEVGQEKVLEQVDAQTVGYTVEP